MDAMLTFLTFQIKHQKGERCWAASAGIELQSYRALDQVECRLKGAWCGEHVRVHEGQHAIQLHHVVLQGCTCVS